MVEEIARAMQETLDRKFGYALDKHHYAWLRLVHDDASSAFAMEDEGMVTDAGRLLAEAALRRACELLEAEIDAVNA